MKPSCTVGGNVNWYSHYEEQYGGSLRKTKIQLAIPLLGIYPKKTILQKSTCTPIFTTALFTVARTWKKPKCPSREEWTKKTWYLYTHTHIHTMEYYSAIRRNETTICRDLYRPRDCHTEWGQKNKYHIISLICGI